MRNIYFVRHGHPQFADRERRCISSTDLRLDEYGWFQAERLRQWLAKRPLTAIYSSPLRRCLQTAKAMQSGQNIPLHTDSRLREVEVGAWENLTFAEIEKQFPREYQIRGRHMGLISPPGGESFLEASRRMSAGLTEMLAKSSGDIVVVSHSGAIRSLLCKIMGRNLDEVMSLPQPYGGITQLRYRDDQVELSVCGIGEKPNRYPEAADIAYLYETYHVSPALQAHGEAVGRCALRLAQQLPTNRPNRQLLLAAGRLHDIARPAGRDHARQGARILRREGYPLVAELVAAHQDLPAAADIEAEILYLADKLILDTRPVTLAERFAASRERCLTALSRQQWQERYQAAQTIATKYRLRAEAEYGKGSGNDEVDPHGGCRRAGPLS